MAWEKTDDEIIAYISNKLDGIEKEAFEKRLESDVALAEALRRHQSFEESLREYGAYQKKAEELRKLSEEFSQERTSRSPLRLRYFLLTAAAILLLLLFFWMRTDKKSICNTVLYSEVFSQRNAPEYAGQAQDAEEVIRFAHSRFNEQKFEESNYLYQQALETKALTSQQADEAHFFLAQGMMAQKNHKAAIENFSKINQGPYYSLSQWYQALSQLALANFDQAKNILISIAETPAHDRKTEAEDLLNKWESLKVCN